MVAMGISTTVHILLGFAFVKGMGMGITGLAIATSIKDCLLFLMVKVYMHSSSKVIPKLQPIL